MFWYLPWSESIKKRACRYLLQRYLGNFLEEKLTLDQLSVDLYNGTGTVSDVSLDCEALNELGDTQSWPLEIVDGHMQEITVTVPWSTLFKDDSIVEINGLSITVQPKVRPEPESSMLESMWSSMSSSMQLAAECLREEAGPQESNPVEGIEMFAHAIDSILSRVKVRFVNTKIRIEHVPKNGDRGIALEIHIKNTEYFDEAGTEPEVETTEPENSKTYIVASYTNKKIKFEGVTFYIDEFPSRFRTMAPSLIMEKSVSSQAERSEGTPVEVADANYQSVISDIFYETRSVISSIDPESIKEPVEELPSRSTREATPEEKNQPEPILFAKLTGEQEIALRMKHQQDTEGPKVDVRVVLGSFILFITPRQMHTLLELADALNQPHLEDTSNIPLRSSGINLQCKPMREADFQLIEAQLLGNIHNKQVSKPTAMHGWSGPSFEESDAEGEKFHPMASPNTQMGDSFSSSVSSMSTSVTSSVNIPTLQPRLKRNKKVPHVEGDPTAEVSHVSIRIDSLSCVLLHKNILISMPMSAGYVSAASAKTLQDLSSEFFSRIQMFGDVEEGKYLQNINDALDKVTFINHLRLLTSEMSLDGSEKVTPHGTQTMCEATIKDLLVRECLYYQTDRPDGKPQNFDIIRFKGDEIVPSKANLRISVKQTSKNMRVAGEKKLVYPTTDIVVKCTPFHVDVDLTLLERMSATVFSQHSRPAPPPAAAPAPAHTQNNYNFSLQSPELSLILRFPIVDLRAGAGRAGRCVRADYLVFQFQHGTLGLQRAPAARPQPTTISLKSTTLDLYYHENDQLPATHIAQSTMDDASFERDILKGVSATPLPMISLTFRPTEKTKGPFDSLHDEVHFEPMSANPMTASMYIMNNLNSTLPSPFSGKKMAHQSIIRREGETQGKEEEIIVPGNEEEMAEFTHSSVENSGIHLDFNLPILSLQLESKQLYEIIYNRINSDLLLWEPQIVDDIEINPMVGPINPAYGMCKVGTGYDSDSDSSSSDDDKMYYSTFENKTKKGKSPTEITESDMHNFCLTFKASKGLLTIYAPVRDSNKRVVPGQMGELVLEAHKLALCQVSGLRRRPKTAQLCLRAATISLYHESILTIPPEKPSLRLYGSILPGHLKNTIYPSNKGVIIKERLQAKDMFTMALKAEPDLDTPSTKSICIALGIEQATLRHRGDKGIAWLSQFMDVLDVLDYPVPGYTPSTVVSELHVHVWDCAVDYRPLYLPIKTVLTLGNFSVSSNAIPDTNASQLRILAQECSLFLAHAATKSNVHMHDDKLPDLYKDYVCVVDLGLFELTIHMEDKSSSSNDQQPQMELTACNNMVNLYTCWDSASALCRLVTYVAADGDSQPPCDTSRHTSICSDQPLEQLVGLEDRPIEEIRELSPNEIQQVNDLMAEAMKESPNSTVEEDELNSSSEKEGVEIFFFPDESNMKRRQSLTEAMEDDSEIKFIDSEESRPLDEARDVKLVNTQVTKDLGGLSSTPRSSPRKMRRKKIKSGGEGSNTDDEYCIVEEQHASLDDEMDEPIVKWIGAGPVYMVDNHFTVPSERTDVLKAPKSFPPPVLRYTLCEMSITWNIFGGNDFRPAGEIVKKTVTIDPDVRRQESPTTAKRNKEYENYGSTAIAEAGLYRRGVSWSAGSERVRPAPQPARPLRTRGGPHRDHRTLVTLALSKVKFQHEVYPPGVTQASRQTVAIAKIEIMDRLVCSDINKLLSQYKLKEEPERTNAHMLIIKAVHLRSDTALPAQECCLKVSLLPLRFNLDQDTLAFLVGYFSKLGTDESNDEDTKSLSGVSTESGGSRQTTPTHRPPVMSIANHLRDPPPTPTSLGDGDSLSLNETVIRDDEPLMEPYEAERLISENLIQLEEDFQRLGMNQEKPTTKPPDTEILDDSPIYFRRVVFSPEVPIRLDYVGKRVDLSAGPVAGLLMGLGQLNCSELTLKRLDYRLGLLGFEKLVQWALHEWLSDIKRHQLPGLLSGIGPMHSLLQIITGIRDLVWLPVEQWRRDGRLVHGLRRGAASFTARTAVAALDLTARLLHLIQATAETAFDMLTPHPPLPALGATRRRARRRDPARQPTDIRDGVTSAYNTVKEGFAETAASMSAAARRGHGGGVLRQLPGAAFTPLALAAAGAADVLGGVRAHLAPHTASDLADKWRRAPQDAND